MPTLSQLLDKWYAGGRIVIDQVVTFPVNFIFPKGGISFGNGSVVTFAGGKIINETGNTIIVQGDDITLKADPEQIFQGDFDFRRQGKSVPNPAYETDHTQPQEIWVINDKPAQWKMERAYPQWFGAVDCSADVIKALSYIKAGNLAAGISQLNEISDSSSAINAAIKLKRRGEVVIPKGYYKICRHISVPPGIQLRGEGTTDQRPSDYGTVIFPWATQGPAMTNSQYYRNTDNVGSRACALPDFPLHPDDVNWLNQGYAVERQYGYMVVVGIKESCTLYYKKISEETDPVTGEIIHVYYSNYPQSIEYKGADGHTSVGTEISSIAFFDLMSIAQNNNVTNDYATLRAILMGGAVTLRDVRVYGLSQLASAGAFSDQMQIEHCSFNDPVKLRSNDNESVRRALYPTKIYGFDFVKGGDAFVMRGCHVSTYNDRIGALKLRSCNGGSITGNILNSDVLIELCRGIDFAGNHLEYGATLTVATSAVSVRDNYIWRGTRPAITLRRFEGDAYNLSHWSAELSNNQLFWRDQHNIGEPQAAQSVYEFDIRTDGYGTLDIHNTFHTSSRLGPAEGSYFGLKMEWMEMHRYAIDNDHTTEVGFSEETASKEPFEEFNRISHIASASSHIEGRNVMPMPKAISIAELARGRDCHSTSKLHFDADLAKVDEKDRWKINEEALDEARECIYKYKAWIYADYSRRLLIPNPFPYLSQEPNCPEAIILDPKYDSEKIGHLQPDPVYPENATDKQYYNLRLLLGRGERSNMDVPIGPYWMYIERTAIKNNQVLNTKAITVPVTSSCMFWDDGEYLSGYAWGDEINSNPASTYNLKPSRVIYHGTNVECICDYEVPKITYANTLQINGSWLDGDIVREMVNGAVVSWLKTASGWKTT